MSRKRLRVTGDSPFNVRDGRGSKGSCFVRAAELLGFGGIVAATVIAALAGCADGALPSGLPAPARAPRPPRDELDRALLSPTDPAGVLLRAWRDQINGAVA